VDLLRHFTIRKKLEEEEEMSPWVWCP